MLNEAWNVSHCVFIIFLNLSHFSGFDQVRAFLQPPVQGVVLQTYGAGNAPNNRPDLLLLFKEAYNWGVIIVNISQCTKGNVGASYATGAVRYIFKYFFTTCG